jgi:hypothetical protein
MRRQQQANGEERTSARWQRRAARQEAERRRVPKHGRGYVDLAQRMILRRAADAAASGTDGTTARGARRKRRPSRARRPSS